MIADTVNQLSNKWWTFLVRGLVALVLAAFALGSPAATANGLVYVVAAYFIISGVTAIVAGFSCRRRLGGSPFIGRVLVRGRRRSPADDRPRVGFREDERQPPDLHGPFGFVRSDRRRRVEQHVRLTHRVELDRALRGWGCRVGTYCCGRRRPDPTVCA